MTPKQQRFCEEYTIDSNGAQAAIRAGYAVKSAKVSASKMLTKPNIRKYVDKLLAEQREQIGITIDSLTEMLLDDRKLAHDNAQAGAAVSATDKMARLHGLMTDRLKVDVTVTAESMSEAERKAERDDLDHEMVLWTGRPWIEEQIARYARLLAEFDSGVFDDHLPQAVARSDGQDWLAAKMALPAPPAAAVVDIPPEDVADVTPAD